MRLTIRKQKTSTIVDQHQTATSMTTQAQVGSRNMIDRIKNTRKKYYLNIQKSKQRLHKQPSETIFHQLTLNAQSIDGSSSSSTLSFIDWIHRGLGPEFQQRQKNHFQEKNPERIVNVEDIILLIPAPEMNTAIQAVDSFGSNVLHLACYHGMDIHILNYILDNISLESKIEGVNSQDKAGNLPLFLAVESILRGKIEVRQGLEVVRRLYLINPKTIFHFNHENYTVSEFVYDHIRHMHTESGVYNQLKLLLKYIRRLMKQAYLLQKKEWEETQRSAMVKEMAASSTQDLTEFEDFI